VTGHPYYGLTRDILHHRGSDVAGVPSFHELYGAVLWYATVCEGRGGFARDDPRVRRAGELLRREEKSMVRELVRKEWARRGEIRT
jgi:hypothetical protein